MVSPLAHMHLIPLVLNILFLSFVNIELIGASPTVWGCSPVEERGTDGS
jgi:hypothetical protein